MSLLFNFQYCFCVTFVLDEDILKIIQHFNPYNFEEDKQASELQRQIMGCNQLGWMAGNLL